MATEGAKPIRHELTKDVFLYITREEDPVAFMYELECAKFNKVQFTIDFAGTENFVLERRLGNDEDEDDDYEDVGTDGNIMVRTVAEPFQRKRCGRIVVKDPTKKAAVKTQYSWELQMPDQAMVQAEVEKQDRRIQAHLRKANELRFGDDSATVAEFEERCRLNNTDFLDPEFPPVDAGLYEADEDGQLIHDGKPIAWYKPRDFMKGPFSVFEGIEPNDIRQGALADCWFLCALASLAEFPKLVENLFLEESREVSEAGVYKLRFCKNGEWQVVTIDDYFPCYPRGGPVYSRSHGDELWVLVLEKAYAKLHGNYAAIKMGWAYEAMLDLTGAPYRTIRFDDEDVREDSGAKLWRDLLAWDEQGYIMSASTPGEDVFTETGNKPEKDGVGLVAGHAYTLLEAKETSQGHRLVMIRNPWGDFEWQGDWSDNSSLWTPEILDEVGAVLRDDDGTFWMCFEDLIKYFFSINVCMVRHSGAGGGNRAMWNEQRRKLAFTYGADGTVSCPMYIMSVQRLTTVFVSIHQEDQRCVNAKPYLDIGVTVLRILPDYTYELVASSGNAAERQNQTEVELVPGQYLVVPTTTGCKFAQAHRHGRSDAPLFTEDGSEFSEPAQAALNEMFRRLDADLDGTLNREELNSFMQMTEACSVNDEVFSWLMDNFDSVDGGLTADGFRECYKFMWKQSGGDDETIWRDLQYMGYDRSLQLLHARTVMLAVHTEHEFELHVQPFDAEAFEEAMELPIKRWGKSVDFDEGRVRMYIRRASYSGVSFAVENLGEQPLEFILDCSESTNVMSHRGSLVAKQRVPPNETKVVHHLMPTDAFGSMTYSYKPSMAWVPT